MPKENVVSKSDPLVETRDYYIENGYWVFTEYFLRKRGYCCGSGCRHCPFKETKDTPGLSPAQR